MADYRLIIIGAGLSGLAAGIRAARFGQKVLLLERHILPGGLNSYYSRHGYLLETGLHAMTNFAPPGIKQAPLNRLFRQLKLSRKAFATHEQIGSEVVFPGRSLRFSNDLDLLADEIAREFPGEADNFTALVGRVREYDPFAPAPRRSAREFLAGIISDKQLADMLLLPLMVYGNSEEEDMDLGQFVIMFRAVFLEGFFRPAGTIKDFLDMLVQQYTGFGGEIRFRSGVKEIIRRGGRVEGVVLDSGETVTGEAVLSTVGIPGTADLAGWPLERKVYCGRMSFMEIIAFLPGRSRQRLQSGRTIIFYNSRERFSYRRPQQAVDTSWGVICFPENFQDLPPADPFQVRVTNAANYDLWRGMDREEYLLSKERWSGRSLEEAGKIVGNYEQDVVYLNSFTPVTIERFTAKAMGAVYGSPVKLKDGRTPYDNLFVAGTDQGYLGIVGAMLSGVTIVNQHLLRA